MRIDEAGAIVSRNMEVGQTTFLKGPPGCGKTDVIEKAAADAGRPCLTESLATYESVDLRGLPMIHAGTVAWAKPDFLVKLETMAADTGRPPVFFVDEANANAQSVQVPLMQLALKGSIGPHHLPKGTSVVMAGNRVSDRAAAQKMPTALANRVCQIDVEPNLQAWLKWAASVRLSPIVTAFLMLRGADAPNKPGLLTTFNPADPNQSAFASPRSWELVAAHDDTPARLMPAIVAGLVDAVPAAEFCAFRDLYTQVPSLPRILANPAAADVPDNPSLRYMIAVAVAQAAKPATFQAVMDYAARLGPELEVVTITEAVRRSPALQQTAPFVHWHAQNAEVTL